MTDDELAAQVEQVRATQELEDDLELAGRLVQLLREAPEDHDQIRRLAPAAVELARDSDEGMLLLVEAAHHLVVASPDDRLAVLEAILPTVQRVYEAAGDDAAGQRSQAMVYVLVHLSRAKARANDPQAAADLLDRALPVAGRVKPPVDKHVANELAAITQRLRQQRQIERFVQRINEDPTNPAANKQLLRIHLLLLDDPVAAVDYVRFGGDADMQKYLPLAARSVYELEGRQIIELGDYFKSLAGQEGYRSRPVLLTRAKAYFAHYLKAYPRQDADHRRVTLMLRDIDQTLAVMTAKPDVVPTLPGQEDWATALSRLFAGVGAGEVTVASQAKPLPSKEFAGLIGHWSFDNLPGNRVQDDTGHGLAGNIFVGADASTEFAPIGVPNAGSLRLDGLAAMVQLDANPSLLPVDAVTFSGWVRVAAASAEGQTVICVRDSTSVYSGYQVMIDGNNRVVFSVDTSSSPGGAPWDVLLTSRQSLQLDRWHHIAATYAPGSARLYVDGELAAENTTVAGAIHYASTTVRFGRHASAYGLAGWIDDFRLFDRALTEAQIRTLMHRNEAVETLPEAPAAAPTSDVAQAATPEAAGSTSVPADDPQMQIQLEQGLVAHLNFDSMDDKVLHDLSGRNHHGSIFGTVGFSDKLPPSRRNNAQVLNLTDGSSYVALDGAFEFNTNDFAVAFWINPSQWKDREAPISTAIYREREGLWDGFHFERDRATGAMRFDVAGDSVAGRQPLEPGKWYHVVGVRQAGQASLYINGELQGTVPAGRTVDPDPTLFHLKRQHMFIGRNIDGANPANFVGLLDDLRVYQRGLDAAEVRAIAAIIVDESIAAQPAPPVAAANPPAASDVPWQSGDPGEVAAVRVRIEEPNLVGCWLMDDGAGVSVSDATGKGLDALLVGQPQWVADEAGLHWLHFEGQQSYLLVPAQQMPAINEQFTIIVRYRATQLPHRYSYLVSRAGDRSPHKQFALSLFAADPDRVRFTITRNGIPTSVDADNVVSLDKWHHIAATYDGQVMKIYVNGNLKVSYEAPGVLVRTNEPLTIAAEMAGQNASQWFEGDIGEVRLYDKALTDAQIRRLFAPGN